MYVLKPSIYDKFQCIGSKCQFHCCQSWRIGMSRDDYDRYVSYGSSNCDLADIAKERFLYNQELNSYVSQFDKFCSRAFSHARDTTEQLIHDLKASNLLSTGNVLLMLKM